MDVVPALVQQTNPDVVPTAQVHDGRVTSASVRIVCSGVHAGYLLLVDDESCLHLGVVAGEDGGEEDVGAWQGRRELASLGAVALAVVGDDGVEHHGIQGLELSVVAQFGGERDGRSSFGRGQGVWT